jgi:acyl-CoA thioester hydrolase
MPAIYIHRHTVQPGEIDALGHVSNIEYLRWTQTAALAHSAAQGWPEEAYHRLGAGWVVRSHQIEYLRPALAGDELAIRTWVASFRKVTSLRRYEIVRLADEQLLARAATDWAFINFATRLPSRVPPEIQNAFVVVGDQPARLSDANE